MREDLETKLAAAFKPHYPIPENIRRLAALTAYSLYFGPLEPGYPEDPDFYYPGYCKALDTVKEWIEHNLPSEVWINLDCDYVSTSEPEGYYDDETGEYIEPYLENTYHLDNWRDIAKLLFNTELINHM